MTECCGMFSLDLISVIATVAVSGVCGYGWLRFQMLLKDLVQRLKIGMFAGYL